MFKTIITLSVSVCVFGFLLDDQKPTNDHDLIRYLDNVVTHLVNLTTKLEKDISTKNDLTQFLQSDLHQLNATLSTETQRRKTLQGKVTQLEHSLLSEKTSNGDLQADLLSTKALVKSLQTELTVARHQITVLQNDVNKTKIKQVNDEKTITNTVVTLQTEVDQMKNQTGRVCYFSLRNAILTSTRGLKFAGVLANYGGSYDTTSGTFIAPYDGAYIFSLTLGVMTNTYTSCYIVKNRFINLVEAFTSVVVGYSSATSSTIVDLAKGDYISVENCHGNGTFSPYKTSFTGGLLNAY